MSFTTLLSTMIVLFCFLAVGVLCSKVGFLDDHTCKKLNRIVINICAPAVVFNSVLNMEYTYALGDILSLLGYAAVFDILMLALALGVTVLFCRSHPDRGTYQYLVSFGNCVFMVFPVITALYGSSAVFLVAVCSIPFNILSFSVGVMIISGGGQRGHFLKSLLNPPFLANFIALLLFLFPVSAPQPLLQVVGYLGNMVIPLSMILIGAALSAMRVKDIFTDWRIYAMGASKLIAAPLAVFFICRLFIRDPLFLNLITISAAMPSASITPIMAAEYGGNAPLASKGVFVTTLCSLITIPVLLSFLLV